MEIIQNNPFRIAGIFANSSERDLQTQKSKIKAYTKVGREITSDLDFNILKKIARDENSIQKAFSAIEQNQDKVISSLFWFLKLTPFDEMALNYLIEGNKEKALEKWSTITFNKDITSKNFSEFNNISTLKLLSNSAADIKDGIETKIKLIESSAFSDFIHSVADLTFTVDSQKQLEQFIEELLKELKPKFPIKDILSLFSRCGKNANAFLSKKFTADPLHSIESRIESTKGKRKSNKRDAYTFGLDLVGETKNDLETLKLLLGVNDLQYKMIADNLAKEVIQCGIDYFQEWQETTDPSQKGISLLTYGLAIAVSPQVKDRAKDNIEGIKEWAKTAPIQKELEFITEKLTKFQKLSDTIANANDLISSCKPKLQKMKSVLGYQDEYYLNISSAIVNNAQSMIIAAVNEEQEVFAFNMNPKNGNIQEVIKIAIKRRGGRVGTPDELFRSLYADNYTARANLINIISGALSVSNTIGTLDMHSELKTRYNTNHSALKSIANQLGISTSSSSRTATTTKTHPPTPEPSASVFWIIFGVVGLIIGLIAELEGGSIVTAIIGAVIGAKIDENNK